VTKKAQAKAKDVSSDRSKFLARLRYEEQEKYVTIS